MNPINKYLVNKHIHTNNEILTPEDFVSIANGKLRSPFAGKLYDEYYTKMSRGTVYLTDNNIFGGYIHDEILYIYKEKYTEPEYIFVKTNGGNIGVYRPLEHMKHMLFGEYVDDEVLYKWEFDKKTNELKAGGWRFVVFHKSEINEIIPD